MIPDQNVNFRTFLGSLPRGMAARNHLFSEFYSLDSRDKPTKAAKLNGVLTSLSPKLLEKYFEGHIADDTSSMRIVSLDKLQQQKLATQEKGNSAVILENCTIGNSKYVQ